MNVSDFSIKVAKLLLCSSLGIVEQFKAKVDLKIKITC